MPRAGLSTDIVVARAADLADAAGLDSLTLAVLAEDCGVRVPSLYKHVGGLADLRRRVALAGLRELHALTTRAVAGRTGRQALGELATAYRAFARARPGRYTATLRAPSPDDEELLSMTDSLTGLLLDVVSDYGHQGDRAVHAARSVRSALHGFVSLEAAGGFGLPQDLDASFDALLAVLDAGLRNAPGS
ncbi:MAG: TetR-like C-terminal domain-containing protein [Dermatophilaceae bacterium]